jgi:ubiquinone/menaquinone biosynthesis C-methylase UbiE
MSTKKYEWDKSYDNGDNFVFYPHEEVVRFTSKFIRKRIGLEEFRDEASDVRGMRVLDLGCGIGRHVIYYHELGLEAYGIDLSNTAVNVALEWGRKSGLFEVNQKIRQGDIRQLPWQDKFFRYAVSHGVLDSMPFEIAREACIELARVMSVGGLFYCDLISGDDSQHSREFSGEEIVHTAFENRTVQSYFNLAKIHFMIQDKFEIVDCNLVRRENIMNGGYSSRYHLVLKRI